jgi:hypothetical protein
VSSFDFVDFGSSLSVRSFARLGSSLSVSGAFRQAGDTTLTTGSKLIFENHDVSKTSYMVNDNSGFQFTYEGQKMLSISPEDGNIPPQGNFHGVWVSDISLATSDRRFKKDITDLEDSLMENMPSNETATTSSWVLRELRPVSFRLKKGSDSKSLRYGFIAQELEQILPPVVRQMSDRKGVLYQDLIAVLTMTAKHHETQLIELRREVQKLREEVEELKKEVYTS